MIMIRDNPYNTRQKPRLWRRLDLETELRRAPAEAGYNTSQSCETAVHVDCVSLTFNYIILGKHCDIPADQRLTIRLCTNGSH